MKIKIKDLKPNPYKKFISGGKLNQEQVNKIKSNLKELGFMGALPIFKKNKKYYLINGHHRVEALKQTYGKGFEVECIIHNYNDEKVLRGMIIENLTQRTDELVEVTENLNIIRNHLKKICSPVEHISKTKPHEAGSIRDIAKWLNKNGEVMALGKISSYLKIYDNLDTKLLKKTIKTQGGVVKEKTISVKEAGNLARLDKKEQPKMKEILDKTKLNKDEKGKLITIYLNSKDNMKKKILKEEVDIMEVELENEKEKLPNNPSFNLKSSEEECAELVEDFSLLKENMEDWEKKTLNKCSIIQLNNMITFLQSFSKDRFLPFGKKIILRLADLGKENGLSPNEVANKFFPTPKISKKEV